MPAEGWDDLTTADDLIKSALRRLGVLASGETYTAQEGLDCLAVLNAMLDRWRTWRLTIYAQSRNVYTLTANTAAYTIGPGGTFSQPRPLWFDFINVIPVGSSLEYPLHIYLPGEWERETDKTQTSTYPDSVHVGTGYSFTTLTFYPVPTTACRVVIYAPEPGLTVVGSLGTAISAPPGYWEALRYNLAVRLAPEFGKAVDGLLMKEAAESLADIKRVNKNMDVLEMPASLPGVYPGRYDINTDRVRW